MADRIPGTTGFDPFSQTDERTGPGEAPGAGFGDRGSVGLDSDNSSTGSGTLVLSGWPRSLMWDEFRELPSRPVGEDEDAQIHSEVEPPSQVGITKQGGVLQVSSLRVVIRTVAEDTWVIKGTKTPELLSHEQGHFDLTGLLGRDSAREILAMRANSREELQSKVNDILRKYRNQATTWTESYDSENNHSQNRDAQKRWDDQIQKAIRDNKPFSPP